jgi:alkylhydroperoxidase/carboxymuconolactone decarboxylase family protein YurZ
MPTRRRDQLLAAWDRLDQVGRSGPLDDRTCRLLELAIAIGTRDREAVRAAHARAVQGGAYGEELDQLVALAASAIGRSATLTTYGWLGMDDRGDAPPGPDRSNPKPSDA